MAKKKAVKRAKNFYTRLTPENKRFIEARSKEMGVSLTAYMNTIIYEARKGLLDWHLPERILDRS